MSQMPRSRAFRALALLTVASLSLGLGGCGADNVLRGKISGMEKIAKQAKDNGAIRCAPRELALAESHLRFATIELEQGFMSKANFHYDFGAVNAQAAYDLSPAQYCAERGFVITPKPGDKDGDGYLDPEDQCPDDPETWNGFQDEDGCPDDPDTDGDGLTDSKDACPLDPEDKDNYLDEDGCPEPDNDLDGILDVKDKCINDPEDPDGFEDEDGCPELDNDKDTVADLEDQCPNEAGDPTAEKKGCPKASLVIVTDKEVKITQQIHFEFDKDKIRPESFPILEAVAEVMRKFPNMKLEIQGHTDNKGAAGYNKNLSDRRAKSVRKYLTDKGKIEGSRLTAVGYGMERPIVDNDTPLNRALNRRVQFIRTETPPLERLRASRFRQQESEVSLTPCPLPEGEGVDAARASSGTRMSDPGVRASLDACRHHVAR
jgi:OmpA-OmpF porin, OOP family